MAKTELIRVITQDNPNSFIPLELSPLSAYLSENPESQWFILDTENSKRDTSTSGFTIGFIGVNEDTFTIGFGEKQKNDDNTAAKFKPDWMRAGRHEQIAGLSFEGKQLTIALFNGQSHIIKDPVAEYMFIYLHSWWVSR
jgi:hypothetical protein